MRRGLLVGFFVPNASLYGSVRLLGLSVLTVAMVGCGPVLLGYNAIFTPLVCAFPGPQCDQYVGELKRNYADMERPVAVRRQLAAGDYVGARQTLATWSPTDSRLKELRAALEKQADVIEARSMLAAGRRGLASSPAEARDNFEAALGRKVLSREEIVEAQDGLCVALFRVGELQKARTACAKATADPNSTAAPTQDLVHAALSEKYEAQVEAALTTKAVIAAKEALSDYRGVPGASPDVVAQAERRITELEAEQQERDIGAALDAKNHEKARAGLATYRTLLDARKDLIDIWERRITRLIEDDIKRALVAHDPVRAIELLKTYRAQPSLTLKQVTDLETRIAEVTEEAMSKAMVARDPRTAQRLLGRYKELT
jgi:hypothetical protein